MSSELEEVKKTLRSVLISSQEALTVDGLCEDYKTFTGKVIPFSQLGFKSVEDMIRAISDVVIFDGLYVKGVNTSETFAISTMVCKQKSSGKKKRNPPQRPLISGSKSYRMAFRGPSPHHAHRQPNLTPRGGPPPNIPSRQQPIQYFTTHYLRQNHPLINRPRFSEPNQFSPNAGRIYQSSRFGSSPFDTSSRLVGLEQRNFSHPGLGQPNFLAPSFPLGGVFRPEDMYGTQTSTLPSFVEPPVPFGRETRQTNVYGMPIPNRPDFSGPSIPVGRSAIQGGQYGMHGVPITNPDQPSGHPVRIPASFDPGRLSTHSAVGDSLFQTSAGPNAPISAGKLDSVHHLEPIRPPAMHFLQSSAHTRPHSQVRRGSFVSRPMIKTMNRPPFNHSAHPPSGASQTQLTPQFTMKKASPSCYRPPFKTLAHNQALPSQSAAPQDGASTLEQFLTGRQLSRTQPSVPESSAIHQQPRPSPKPSSVYGTGKLQAAEEQFSDWSSVNSTAPVSTYDVAVPTGTALMPTYIDSSRSSSPAPCLDHQAALKSNCRNLGLPEEKSSTVRSCSSLGQSTSLTDYEIWQEEIFQAS